MQTDYISGLMEESRGIKGPQYINVPFFIISDNRWNRVDSLLIGLFISLVNAGKEINASNSYLGKILGCDERTIQRSLKKLTLNGVTEPSCLGANRSIKLSTGFQEAASIKDNKKEICSILPRQHCHPYHDNIVANGDGHTTRLSPLPRQGCRPKGVDTLLYNIKEYNILGTDLKKNKNDPISKKCKKDEQPKKESGFSEFWEIYPIKKSKKKSLEIWIRKNLYKKTKFIIEKLEVQIKCDFSKKDSRFIPHPSTYLNSERWDDEISNSVATSNAVRPKIKYYNPNEREGDLDDHKPIDNRYLRERSGDHSKIDPASIRGHLTGIRSILASSKFGKKTED